MNNAKPEPREIELIDPRHQQSKVELEEDLRVNSVLEELAAAVVRPARIHCVNPERER